MKRTALAVLTSATAALLLMGAGRDGGGGGRGGSGGTRSGGGGRTSSSSPSTIYRQRRVPVPRPVAPARMVRDQIRAPSPARDGSGASISKPAATLPPSHHKIVARNAGVMGGIDREQRMETEPNRYYWHESGGVKYSHYYDGSRHWYGFYHGPTFYWTRYNAGRWWWFDAGRGRWDYWWDGFWWWPTAGGAPYVYVDNNYYPYENEGVTVQTAEVQAPPAAVPAPAADAGTVSPDGSRVVQIVGSDAQAFLYDKSAPGAPTFLKYLGQGASKAKFTGGTAGAPLQIMLEFKDNTYALYDANGNSMDRTVISVSSGTVPPSDIPTSIPPPPTSAPGQ